VHDDSLTVQANGFVSRFATNMAYLSSTTVTTINGGRLLWWNLPDANEHPLFYVGIFGAIGCSTAVVSIFNNGAQLFGTLRASRQLFRRLLFAVVHATFRWHDTTPQGRMLNRFGKDIETVDGSLGRSLEDVNSSLANFLASGITIGSVRLLLYVSPPAFKYSLQHHLPWLSYSGGDPRIHLLPLRDLISQCRTRSPSDGIEHEITYLLRLL
jgi:ABC-type multidrug transport system fused ATPase/permease subunit